MNRAVFLLVIIVSFWSCTQQTEKAASVQSDPLPSWNDSQNKATILDFIKTVSDENSKSYVPVEDRIAVFDNDGTLWIEKPLYIPVEFEMAWISREAISNTELLKNDLYKGLATGDLSVLKNYNTFELIKQLFAAHAGQSVDDYMADAGTFLDTAKHQKYQVLYKHLTYNPMVELITYLRQNDFDVFIVTGGEIDFLRAVSEEIYNIPPEKVIGSSVKYEFLSDANGAELIRTADLGSANDKFVKPTNIQLHIGKKPIFAAGNSDGDYEMMEYTLSGYGPSMAILVHHDDSEREYVYMHGTEKAMEDAKAKGWHVVSMKNDFKLIFD
jgi:phosphoglycolate phosphatase-like HAD superfamily hydrolase